MKTSTISFERLKINKIKRELHSDQCQMNNINTIEHVTVKMLIYLLISVLF